MLIVGLAVALVGCGEPTATGNSMLDVGLMRVQDRANIIPAAEEIELARQSEALERATTDQLAVVTVPTLHGEDIARYSRSLGNRIGIGQADKDNGVLVVLALNERRVRVAVGLGLQGLLTDRQSSAIIRDMMPYLRSGNAAHAIRVGSREIDEVLRSDIRRPRYLQKAA